MSIEVGSIVEGKISGVMPFGAFISLPDDKTGLIHISEIAQTYVADINEHIKVGDVVKAKVLNIDEKGKISLSIKKAIERKPNRKNDTSVKEKTPIRPDEYDWSANRHQDMSFEDKLSKFKQDSDEKILALKRSNDSKRSGGYRRGAY